MNPPKILDLDVTLVDNAISHWRAGDLVAIPTETVYGLAADATNGEAVARIYQVKSRPQFNPLIVHVANAEIAQRYVEWNALAESLAAAFWPGPLTLILKRHADCPISELVSAGGNTMAIRVPAHPIALQLLKAWDGGIAAPSANRSGRISPTTAEHVREELGEAIPLIIDGGPCEVGIESTVVDCTGDAPVILRAGAITQEMMEQVTGGEWQVPSDSPVTCHPSPATLLSPGMLASHYAPNAALRLNAHEVSPSEVLLAFGPEISGAAYTLNLSPTGNMLEAASNLFAHLRTLDHYVESHDEIMGIAVMPIPAESIGVAINDRLARAAAPRP